MRPPIGLHIPVRYSRCRDGDTVEVSTRHSVRVWAIRLLDCWCAESNTEEGRGAKEFAESVLENCEDLTLFVPLTDVGPNLLRDLLSFDRMLGVLWVSETQTLNDMLVEAGYATREKTPR